MKMKITLTPNEVEQIIKEHLEQKFKNVGEIKLEVGQEMRGQYTSERYVAVFKGATCDIEGY